MGRRREADKQTGGEREAEREGKEVVFIGAGVNDKPGLGK